MIKFQTDLNLLIWFVSDKSSFLNRRLDVLNALYPDLKITVSYKDRANVK